MSQSQSQSLTNFFLQLAGAFVLVVIVLPTTIYTMFPSRSPWVLGSGYLVAVFAAIVALYGVPDIDNPTTQVGLKALAVTVVGPMILLAAFPSTNRFMLIASYLVVVAVVSESLRKRHNLKSREAAQGRPTWRSSTGDRIPSPSTSSDWNARLSPMLVRTYTSDDLESAVAHGRLESDHGHLGGGTSRRSGRGEMALRQSWVINAPGIIAS